MAKNEINASEIVSSYTLVVKGVRLARLRFMLSFPFLWLASVVMGVGFEIEGSDDASRPVSSRDATCGTLR